MNTATQDRRRRQVLQYVAAAPTTVDEFLLVNGNAYVNSWAPVFTHLKREGMIEASGEFRDTRHGVPANVWRITPAGEDALCDLAEAVA